MPVKPREREQINLILKNLPDAAAYPDPSRWDEVDVDDVEYLYRKRTILARDQDAGRVAEAIRRFFEREGYGDVPEGEEIRRQHYAFLVSEEDFDAIYGKIKSRGLQHWADPRQQRPGEINHNDGGRGVYFPDPSGHGMEILTRPYGSGG